MPIIPEARLFDQQTLTSLLEHHAVVQRYRAFFARCLCLGRALGNGAGALKIGCIGAALSSMT